MRIKITSINLISILKSSILTMLLSLSLGASAVYASDSCSEGPYAPAAQVGTTVILVPGHYRYFHRHHRMHRVYIRTHYVGYMRDWGNYDRYWVRGHMGHHGHWIRGHYRYYEYYPYNYRYYYDYR